MLRKLPITVPARKTNLLFFLFFLLTLIARAQPSDIQPGSQVIYGQHFATTIPGTELNQAFNNIKSNNTYPVNPLPFAPQKRNRMKYHFRKANPRDAMPFGFHIQFGGPEYIGGSLDYFLTSWFEVAAGAGLNGTSLGFRYHITGFRGSGWTPFLGLMPTLNYKGRFGVFVPGGLSYLGGKGFAMGIEFGLWVRQSGPDLSQPEYLGPGAFWIGYHFK